MAKTPDDLKDSRDIRQFLIAEWGCIPGSIWKVGWQVSSEDNTKSYGDQQADNKLKVGNAFSLSGTGARHGALSRFPQDLCRFLVKFYTKENDTVLDPFAGHNSRMESVYLTNRNYIGFDICEEYMNFNMLRAKELEDMKVSQLFSQTNSIELIRDDSRNINNHIKDNTVDFCITSPPFWNIEYYGPEPEQLGLLTYNSFLDGIKRVVAACMWALKPNSFIAWEVNDFRKDGRFYCYHYDIMSVFESVGLKLHDIIIVDYGNAFLKSFLSDVDYLKVMPKQHAYIIVGQKQGMREIGRVENREVLKEKAKNSPQLGGSQIKIF